MLNHNYTNVSVPARECWYCLWRLWDRNLFKYICKWAHKILFNKYSDICSYTILEQSWTLELTLWIKSCCNVVFSGTKKMVYFVHIWTGDKKITDCQVLFLEDFKWSSACVIFATQETRTQWMICETAQCEQWASAG